ncbi:hypothetical protein G7Z17_g3646 [Cylindrodendrum hubeiense]|uniref:chitinase n=1 Tax=Cylindrodendrum hubeiense TaxID=595255 RepID=A0A9P5HIF1_9HYPO|nr:hypothetical protein G7Z17_g3646 [Cylindrodendrum hubeiense]
MNRECNVWEPFMIDATKWTHLNYAFALIDESTYEIAQMNTFDTALYGKLTDLKSKNPILKVYISVGGWDAGSATFSAMVSTKANRATFIRSTIKFMKTYIFDGIDINWAYPTAKDRGGEDADFENFVTFLAELRDAFGDGYGITVALPSSYWYLKGFDIANMEQHVDWFNLMSHDIHGKWDGKKEFIPSVVQAHTNLTEIKDSLNLLWRNSINPNKVVLGLGFYGRSFTLEDVRCKEPGCPFSGAGELGKCTDTAGILSLHEIKDIMEGKSLEPVQDGEAAVKYISWDGDQWVSYDDSETFAMKLSYAKILCLGGTSVWALDLDALVVDEGIDSLLESDSRLPAKLRSAVSYENGLSMGMFWTPCFPPTAENPCPDGFSPLIWAHGKVFDADLSHVSGMGCYGGGRHGYHRALCVEGLVEAACQWGPGSQSKACNSKCPTGYITLTKNSHMAGQDTGYSKTLYNDYANQYFSGGLGQKVTFGNSRSYSYVSDDENSVEVRAHNALRERQLEARSAYSDV